MSVILDTPNDSFKVGDYQLSKPFHGLNVLQVITQTWGSTSERFPSLGSSHPDRGDFTCFDIGQTTPIGGGVSTCVLMYAKTTGKHEELVRTPVQFAGIRMRKVPFNETYTETATTTTSKTIEKDGTFVSVPVTRRTEHTRTRQLEANEIVVREPFTQEVYCTRETSFVNLAVAQPTTISPIQITDSNKTKATDKIDEAYQKKRHPDSTGYTEPSLNYPAFTERVLTPYYSETSSPSIAWYAGKVGTEGMVVLPTEVTQYIGGQLRQVVNLKTKYL
jgi:hypothetical protein